MAATSKYVAVVAIDFGTTYSGFAFSFNNKKGEGGIHMNREWGNDEGRRTMKTPTTILLTPTKKFDSFGYDADEKYVHFKREEQKRYYYFKHFKMELHKTKNLDRSTQLTATNGKTAEALLVFSLSIKYMKERAVEIIRERTGDERYTAKDIQWVITVPAIWTPAAKQFMREAAYKAGISSPDNSEQLIVALEPEGAAIFCRERKMRDFADEKGDASVSDVFARPGSKYLMMDIGGGTLDVTAHEILDDGTIKEIHHVTGGPYGGIYVDDKFVSLLESLFGIPTVKNFRSSYPAEWLRMINDFEMKKRGRRAFEGKNTRIILPRDFARLVSDPKSASLSQSLERFGIHKDVEIYNGEYLSLGPNAMKQLFEPVVTGIVKHMTGLFMRPALGNISSLFMVGGFAESVFLQESIKRAFGSRCTILIPNSANIAVVQGATMFGQKPTIVNSRIMATTYGFEMYEDFNPKVHRLDKKEVIEGKVKCKDCFKVVVKENEAVKVGEKKCFLQHPIHSKQKKMAVEFFTSTDPKVKYISDPTVGPCIGKMTVSSPDTSKGKDRELEVSVYFGETEIKATAVDKTSGNTATAYLDFLCKS